MKTLAIAALLACSAKAQQQPDIPELLDALGRSAAIFARSVPGLAAQETLRQKGRRGNMQILKKGRKEQLKNVAFTIPDEFQTHEVISNYSFGVAGGASGFHEIRKVVTIDKAPVPVANLRHSLTLGATSADDETKKMLLEDLEQTQLQGSVVDFGPMLLLFTKQKQFDFEFRSGGRKDTIPEAVFVLNYRQLSGSNAVTEFRDRSETKHPLSGQIWLRESDLIPTRITVRTEEILTTKYTLSNEAEIDYQPTPYGLAPAMVVHRQYLNQDLLVENQFRYTDYHGRPFVP